MKKFFFSVLVILSLSKDSNAQFSAFAGNDTTICSGTSFQLNATASGGVPPLIYQWSPSTGLSNTGISNPFVNIPANPSYCTPIQSTNYLCCAMAIGNVTTTGGITNFNNSSTLALASYENFYNTAGASADTGATVNISCTSVSYGMDFNIYIDYNDNGLFTDAGELVLTMGNTSPGVVNGSFTVPSTASAGNHRMRIRAEYYGTGYPTGSCTTLSYGETEDYRFTVTSTQYVYTYYLTVTDSNNLVSVDTINITPTLPLTISVSTQESSAPCIPIYTFGCGFPDVITNVTFAGINNSTGLTCGQGANLGYDPIFTSPNPTINASSSYSFSATTGGDIQGLAAWIDYNHDGVFSSSELIANGYAGTLPATYTANVSIPMNASNGPTILRVRSIYILDPTTLPGGGSCASTTYGEDEDYKITIDSGVPQSMICSGSSIQLMTNLSGGGSPYNYSWTPSTGLSSPSIANPIATPLVTTTYHVLVTDACGNSINDSIIIPVSQTCSFFAFAGNDTTICSNGSAQLHATASGGIGPYTYAWLPGAYFNNPSIANPICTPPLGVTPIYLYITDGNNVVVSDTMTITSLLTPTAIVHNFVGASCAPVLVGGDLTFCSPFVSIDSFKIDFGDGTNSGWLGQTAASQFVWHTYGNNPGSYHAHVYVMEIGGCSADSLMADSVTVIQSPNLVVTPSAINICLGDTVTMNVGGAVTYNYFPPGINLNPPFQMAPTANTLYYIYGTGANSCQDSQMIQIYVDSFCVWPGDANYDLTVDNADLLPIGLDFGNAGPLRNNASLLWVHQPAGDWSTSNIYNNDKHSDTNGDGMIDDNDTLAIYQNYGFIHPRLAPESHDRNIPELHVTFSVDTVNTLDTVYAIISLGDTGNLASNIYGIAYTLNYNSLLVDTTQNHLSYDNSWLAPNGNRVNVTRDFPTYGTMKTAVSRTNHTDISGTGVVSIASVVVSSDNIDGRVDDIMSSEFHVWLSNITAVDANGNAVALNAGSDSLVLRFVYTNLPEFGKAKMLLFPNPASDEVTIMLQSTNGQTNCNELVITDVTGREVKRISKPQTIENIDISNFSNGIYFIKATGNFGMVVKKLVKQ